MKTCERCGKQFPTSTLVGGVRKNIGSRKYCLECSPWGSHNTRRFKDSPFTPTANDCELCGRGFQATGKSSLCNSCSVTIKRLKNKMLAISYLGGECKRCGFRGDPSAFDFHHRESAEKEFRISGKLDRTSWEKLRKELDKCDLMCSSCHREIHSRYSDRQLMMRVIGDALDWERYPWFDAGVFEYLLEGDDGQVRMALKGIEDGQPDVLHRREVRSGKTCSGCGGPRSVNYHGTSGLCLKCSSEGRRKVQRPTREELEEMLSTKSWMDIARQYGVSDNSVRKWARRYGLIQ